jgi:hypothetical protein
MALDRLLPTVAVAALLVAVPQLSHADTDPRVADLVDQSGAALHVAAMRSIGIVHAEGDVVASGLSGRGGNWNELGGTREASRFSTPPLAGGSGWDGNASWNLDQTGLVIVDGSVLGRSTAIDQAYVGNYDLWTPGYGGATVVWGGAKTENGTPYDVLTVTPPKSSLPIDVWFDRSTHLPVKVVQTAGPMVTITTMAEYRPVNGLMFPYRIDTSSNTGDNTSFTATSVDINPPSADAQLDAPTSAPHDFSIANGATQTSVPFQIVGNHVYLDVTLNGKGPYHFVFDTGGENIIDPAVAKEIGATSSGASLVNGTGNASESSSFAIVKTLQAGDATVNDQVFTVLPVRKGIGRAAGAPTDGLIGYEVLSRFVTTFDYANKTVVFHLPGTYTAPAGATVVPIAQYGTQPQFPCAIDDVPATCTLDTGARESLMFFAPFVEAHPSVVPATLTALGVNGFGVGGASSGRLGRVQSLAFGGLTLHDLVGEYPSATHGALAMPFLGANVGGAVWKRFTMTLDYHRLTMTLTPNAEFGARERWDRSGVFLVDKGGITIIDVRPGTPAAKAGLTKGEVITALDGSSTLSLASVREAFLGDPGTVVHLVIKSKDGATHAVDLTLADYV